MSKPKDLESRVERLERAVFEVRQDAAAARVLAGAADRDVSEFRDVLRGHARLLNAMRETQAEHGQQLVALGGTLAEQGGRIDALERKMSDGFSTLNVGMAQIVALLRDAEEK